MISAVVLLGTSVLAVIPPSSPAIEDRLSVFERFGISTTRQLASALEGPDRFQGRQAMWIRSWLHDAPGVLDEANAILRSDPLDLEAVKSAADSLYSLGDAAAALALVDESLRKPLVVRDARGGHASRESLVAWRCSVLQLLRDPRASSACREAVESDEHPLALRHLAQLALRDGEMQEALELALRATRAETSEHHDHGAAWSWYLVGMAHEALGQEEEARTAFDEALRRQRSLTPAWRARNEPPRSVSDRLSGDDDELNEEIAGDLATCALWYSELGLPGPADRCLAAAARRSPPRAAAVRVAVLAKEDAQGALRLAESELQKTPHVSLLSASGWLRHRMGDDAGARRDLEQALVLDPVHFMANVNLGHVCLALGDDDCADEHFARAHGEPDSEDVIRAVVKFLALLVPVLALYVFVRRRIVSRGAAGVPRG